MAVTRNRRAGIDDRWTRRVKVDGKVQILDSPLKGRVKRWRVRWVDDHGRERSKSYDRKVDAQRFLDKLTADIVRGEYVDPDKGRETFESVAREWLKTKSHRKPKTVAGYESLLRTVVLPKWGKSPLTAITYGAYLTWLGDLAIDGSQRGAPLSASRIIQAHQLTGAVLAYAQRTGRIPRNPVEGISRAKDLPTPAERERRYLTHEQLLTLASHIEPHYRVMTLVLGYCGLRFGEAAALRRRHVGSYELVVRSSASSVAGSGVVETSTKTHRTRHVPVPRPVWDELIRGLPSDPDAYVFPSLRGGVMSIDEYRWRFNKACTAAGIRGVTPHDLRHTCASLAISAGANVKVVQRLLGHATAAMTLDRYGHLFDDDLSKVADALSVAIESTAVPLRYPVRDFENDGLPDGA